MITVRQHEKLIDRITSLSELELSSLLKDIADYIHKERLQHLIDDTFQIDDYAEEIEDLQKELSDLEDKVTDYEDTMFEVFKECESAEDIEDFEEGAFDTLKKSIAIIKRLVE